MVGSVSTIVSAGRPGGYKNSWMIGSAASRSCMRRPDPGGHPGQRHQGLMIGRQLLVGLVQNETQEKSFGQHRGEWCPKPNVSNVCPATLLIGNSQEIFARESESRLSPIPGSPRLGLTIALRSYVSPTADTWYSA
jgi:hypothetical protein